MLSKEYLAAIGQLMDEKLKPIQETLDQHTEQLKEIDTIKAQLQELDTIKAQLKDIDISIGMLADWADNVAVITKVPFASGKTAIN